MKKFLALILAMLMIASMSITAFAADDDDSTGLLYGTNGATSDSDVNVVISGDVPTGKVYYVNVSWKNLDFTYSFVQGVTWNPEAHQYEKAGSAVGAWNWYKSGVDANTEGIVENVDYVKGDANGVTLPKAITVTNHSNATVNVSAAFITTDENGSQKTDAAMTTSGATATIVEGVALREIKTAEGTEYGSAPDITYSLTVGGTPSTDTGFKLGVITVTVAKEATSNT